MTKIAVAIVNYNTCDYLRACLASVVVQQPCAVIVVDNASSDNSTSMVRSEFPCVDLQITQCNIGYGAASNIAIRHSSAEYVLLLNSDTLVAQGSLEALTEYLDTHPTAAVVGPRLLNADGTLQASAYLFPTPLNLFLEESTLYKLIRFIPVFRRRYVRTWDHSSAKVVSWTLGAALAIRREAFEAIGGFNESYFMYFEEVDLCYRLSEAGWQVHFSPAATITHTGGASTRQQRAEMIRLLFSSAATFYNQHYSPGRMVQLKRVVAMIMLVKIIRDTIALSRTRDPDKRQRIMVNLDAWHQVLADVRAGWKSHEYGPHQLDSNQCSSRADI